MIFFFAICFFMFGAVIASFVGVVSARLYTGEGFFIGRSRCDICGTTLPPIVLVPVISYITLGGRARCCGARLSFIAPLTESALGALFTLSYLRLGLSIALFSMLVSLSLLFTLVLYDLAHQILPPILLTLFVGVSAATGWLLTPFADVAMIGITALGIALFLALLHVGSRGRAMGLADAPLAFGLALLVGPFALSGFVFSFWIGAAIGIALLADRPRHSRMNTEVPFAPFLAAGFLLAYFTQWNPFATFLLVAFR